MTREMQVLGDKLANLTLAETVKLTQYLDEVHGIKPATPEITYQPWPQEQTEVVPVQTDFAVVLEGLHDLSKKVVVIKVVRELTPLGLREAKDAVEQLPRTIVEGVSKAKAEEVKSRLEAAGGKVSIK